LKLNKKGIFGLTSIQMFFAVILGLALLAYAIVIIMGVLSTTTILQQYSTTAINTSTVTKVNETGVTIPVVSIAGFSCSGVTTCVNATDGVVVVPANYTTTTGISGCTVKYSGTAGAMNNTVWKCSYTYDYDSTFQNQQSAILVNTSTGITSFFGAITPIYAILAILVIILVLVVLVRVVQAPNQNTGNPQL
jgi:uncharacterized membrane protein